MRQVLLVNLMRMGDLLQTTPVIRRLREHRPGTRISILVNEAFVEAARRIDVDEVFPVSLGDLREALRHRGGFVSAYGTLRELVEEVEGGGPYDLVFNLTPSPAAASLASLLAHRAHRGLWLESDGSLQAADPWSAYLVAMMSDRRSNPFHLVDIWLRTLGFRGGIGLRMSLYEDDLRKAHQLLGDSGLSPDRELLIGFQISASQQEKCWSEEQFVRLGRALSRDLRARVVLFGVGGEEERACGRVSERIPGAVSLAGKTDLGSLGAVLKHCRLLVTNDTGTQHVAAAVGTRVIVISLGPVFFRETGPYGEGHLIFQAGLPCAPCSFHVSCLNPICKEKIRAEDVYPAVIGMLRGKEGIPSGLPREVTCYRAVFDRQGWIRFATSRPSTEDHRIDVLKRFWLPLLEGRADRAGIRKAERGPWMEGGTWLRLASLLQRFSDLMVKILEVARRGHGDPGRLRILSENLRAVEREMRGLAMETEVVAPLVHYLHLRREALSFEAGEGFLSEASRCYAEAAEEIVGTFGPPLEEEGRKEAWCDAGQC